VADITVQVSSAGLTAYGSETYGFGSFGGDQSPTISVNTVEAFNNQGWGGQTWGYAQWGELVNASVTLTGIELQSYTGDEAATPGQGWGRYAWGSIAWGQNFEDITVEVTTPGTATVWGYDVWGDAEWGQISGMDTDQGSAELTVSVDVQIDTTSPNIGMITGSDGVVAGTSHLEELTSVTANPFVGNAFGGEVNVVQVTSPSNDPWGNSFVGWGNGLWGAGDGISLLGNASVTAQGDGLVTLTGEQANTAVGQTEIPVTIDTGIEITSTLGDAFGGPNIEIQLTTASAQPWGEVGWGDGEWGQSVGTDIAIGADAVLTPSIDVPVTGEQLDWTIGTETVTGDANVTLSGVSAEVFQGDENAFTDVTVIPTGQLSSTQLANVVAGISQLIIPTGLEATTTSGTMGINAWAVIEPNASTTWSIVDKAAA
jgi:hypothetical protein